jgi:hypothetical protein
MPEKPKKQRLPDLRRFSVFDGMAEEDVREVKKEYICSWCGEVIKIGSPARRLIPIDIVKRKALINSQDVKYVHRRKEDCVGEKPAGE